MNEIWKDIPHYEGLYQVSNLGRVKSLDRTVVGKDGNSYFKKGCFITQHDNTKGYLFVYLWRNNESKREYTHRLVALAFIDNPEHKPQVDHIDTDRQNNRAENLRWVTQSENNLNPATNNKRIGRSINGMKIVKCDMDGNQLEAYNSMREAERKNNLANGVISQYFQKHYAQCGGYTWQIID